MGHVFISYSRDDGKAVDRLVTALEKAGHEVWRDTQDIEGGDQWRRAIVGAIKSGQALIVAISPRSITSQNVRKELDVAEQAQVRIIPVRLRPVEIPDEMQYQLAGVQEIDISADFKSGFTRLNRVLGGDERIAQPARKNRAKRRFRWTLGGVIVGGMLGFLVSLDDSAANVSVPGAIGAGAFIGAVLGFASGLAFALIGWISKLVGWLALLVGGAVLGAFGAAGLISGFAGILEGMPQTSAANGEAEATPTAAAGALARLRELEPQVQLVGAVLGVLLVALAVHLIKRRRKARQRAEIAALATAA